MAKAGKEQLIDSVRSNIRWYESKLEQAELLPIDQISADFPHGEWSVGGTTAAEFKLPFDFSLIETVKKYMAETYPEFRLKDERQHIWNYKYSGPEAGRFLEYTRDDGTGYASFTIAFRTGIEGTTCVLQKLGTQAEEVFEVVCGAGAAEGL